MHFYILNASFHVYEVKFGGVVWVWKVIKEDGGGGGVGEIPWLLFCPFVHTYTLVENIGVSGVPYREVSRQVNIKSN